MADFFTVLSTRIESIGSPLCVGLDPRVKPGSGDPEACIVTENRRIIEATAPCAAAFKPNIAFYEAWGEAGMRALRTTMRLIPESIPVIMDAKRGDIGPTAEAYAKAIFDDLSADAVTLSPYMGRDAADPFLSREGKAAFLLARNSNPGSRELQDLEVLPSRERLYLAVARMCAAWGKNVGLVVAGNEPKAMSLIRRELPNAWFLAPGIGTQGGDIPTAWAAGATKGLLGLLPVAARAVSEAPDPAQAATRLRDEIRAAATGVSASGWTSPAETLKLELMKGLIDTGCFKLGDFTLKSGKKSPFYVDLRRVISEPRVLGLVAKAYEAAMGDSSYDRIAGIPAAALPLATAVSLRAGKPLIWPRMPVKDHGTGNRVEGAFAAGERIMLLDDLITTGLSKIEAIDILRGEGLVVEELVVLIERGGQGRRDMEAKGVKLKAFLHVSELFALCERLSIIDGKQRGELEAYAKAE